MREGMAGQLRIQIPTRVLKPKLVFANLNPNPFQHSPCNIRRQAKAILVFE